MGASWVCAGIAPGRFRSLLAEYEIDDPAPANVRRGGVAAVREDVVGVAARVLKRVGQYRHRAEVARIIHLPCEGNGGVSPPPREEGDRAEGVAEDVAEDHDVLRFGVAVARER